MDAEINGIGETEDEYQHEVKVLNERVEAIFASDASGDRASREARELEQGKRIDARAMLMDQFGIDSAFVRVPTLARVLNLAPAGIYAAIRENRFFIPHRMLFSAPAVKLDDLVEWYCADDASQRSKDTRQGQGVGNVFSELGYLNPTAKAGAKEPSTGRISPMEIAPNRDAESQSIEPKTEREWRDDFGETESERLKREKQAIIRAVKSQMKCKTQ